MYQKENEFDALINAASARYNVPVVVIKAVIGQESSFNPNAYRAEPAKNDASRGLMQLMTPTARDMGWKGTDPAELFKPEVNIPLGVKYLRWIADRYRKANPSYPANTFPPADAIYSAYNQGGFYKNADGTWKNQTHVDLFNKVYRYFYDLWQSGNLVEPNVSLVRKAEEAGEAVLGIPLFLLVAAGLAVYFYLR